MRQPGSTFLRLLFQGACCVAALAVSTLRAELLPPGFRPLPLGVHALIGAKVVLKPGEVLESATIVIRDGLIQSVSTNLAIPADARVWDLKGATVYAGFIEPYLVPDSSAPPVSTTDAFPVNQSTLAAGGYKFYGAPGVQADSGNAGAGYPVARITPEFRVAEKYSTKQSSAKALRELGFTVAVVAPAKGIIRGTSALVTLADENPNRVVIKPDVFQHIAFDTSGNDSGAYPNSLMGIIAAIRQTFFDAQHYVQEQAAYAKEPLGKRPEFNPALAALEPVLNKKLNVIFEPGSALMNARAAGVARELGLNFSIVSCGEEWRRPDLAKAIGGTFIVPVNFPSMPKLPSEEDWDQVSLDQLRGWDWAAENPALLRQQGLQIALTTYGLGDKKNFRKNVQLALDRGLTEADALAALTTIPARLCGVENQLGSIEPGKLANLLVVNGSYFQPDAKIRAVWIDGKIYPAESDDTKSAKADEAKSVEPPSERGLTPAKEEPEKHPKLPEIAAQETRTTSTNAPTEPMPEEKNGKKQDRLREAQKTRVARLPMDDRGAIANPDAIYIHGATVWSCVFNEPPSIRSILIEHGKIKQIGNFKAEVTAGTLTIEGQGLHVAPGIIDCHSHAAVLGDVNETGLPSTAMVRIGDVVNSESPNIRRELAGGVTTLNLLHGSANPIGGQNCVIKLRDGVSPGEMVFSNAPAGIKFALGENVKQANWGDKFTTRFPQSRMGVRTFVQNRFVAAQEYIKQWERFQKFGGVAPRHDLELEAIAEILHGQRWIHCHAYRQDEMLMLTRLMQDFHVQIGTFQHGLDAYKIADELAAAHIGVSTFSDWWGIKFELYDAIPYNGALLHDRGVLVSFNSDFSELARRLYLEAAKAVKYGGVSEIDALKLITLNPAKQLRIDRYVGSLEPGKDADFVVWSKSPLDSGTVCLQTWIDGKKYFDRALEEQHTARLKKEREDLIAKAKKLAALAAGGSESKPDSGKSFFRVSLEHQYDDVERRCEDE